MKKLNTKEQHILDLVRRTFSPANTEDDLFETDDNEICIFAKDESGQEVMMVNLSFLAELQSKDCVSDDEICKKWLSA